jgi:hypothetical protein
MSSYMIGEQLTTLCYCSTNFLASFNLNIPVNKTELFRSTDFWNKLYMKNSNTVMAEPVLLDFYGNESCTVKIKNCKRVLVPEINFQNM